MLKEIKIYEELKEAYETTTRNCNRFLEKLLNINWENTFIADGERYFIYGDLIFTAQSLDPFNEQWGPCATFKDGSAIYF